MRRVHAPIKDYKKYSAFYNKNRVNQIPYEEKLRSAEEAVKEYIKHFNGMVFLEYGGGLKSDVLLHIVRKINPAIKCIYIDNGTDYEPIRKHALSVADIVKIPNCTMKDVINEFGYPFINKRVDSCICELRKWENDKKILSSFNILTGKHYTNINEITQEELDEIEWLYTDFDISPKCCELLFDKPIEKAKRDARMAGISPRTFSDNRSALRMYMHNDSKECIFHTNKNEMENKVRSRCYPLMRWNRADIIRYIDENNVPYCKEFYGDITKQEGKTKIKYNITKEARSKCKFCPYNSFKKTTKNKWETMKELYRTDYQQIIGGGTYINGKWKPDKKGLGFAHLFEYKANVMLENKYRKY